MRILQVVTSLEIGGAETLICNMIPFLRQKGLDVDLCLFNGKDTPLLQRLGKDVRIYKLGKSYYNIFYIFKLIRIMRNYEIIHSHNSSPQLFVAIANLLCKKAIVTTEHSTKNRKRENAVFRLMDKWMYRQYNATVCISHIARESLIEHLGYEKNEKILVICNGIDVNTLHNTQPIDRSLFNSSNKHFVVTMVAGFRKAKDQDTLIKAMARLPKDEYELWLVGDGERKDKIRELIEKEDMSSNTKLLGVRVDVPAILKASDVVVMSSHWEGMSLSNLEGMSVGKPFVASDVNGLRQVTKGYGLLFPHEDDKTLSEILLSLKSNKVFYSQVAEKCYERAKMYDIAHMVNQYIHIYDSVIQ